MPVALPVAMIIAWDQLAAASAILLVGASLQSAVGFGMGLISVPLLVWSGLALPHAVALLLGAAVIQTGYGTYVMRADVRWRSAAGLAAVRALFVPVGVSGMAALVAGDQHILRQAVGAAVVVLVTAQLWFRPDPRPQVHWGWAASAGALSGVLAGLIGMGGPPIVFYALAHGWSNNRFRGFLWSQFLLLLPVMIAVMTMKMDASVLVYFALGLAMAPVSWLGTRAGIAVAGRWSSNRLRTAAVLLLYVVGLSGLLSPYYS
jgi:uncharacterized protein